MATQVSEAEVKSVHHKLNEIGGRLASDSAFKAKYEASPLTTLTEAGLPEQAAKEVLSKVAELNGQDVTAYDYYVDEYVYIGGLLYIERDWYTDFGHWYYTQYFRA